MARDTRLVLGARETLTRRVLYGTRFLTFAFGDQSARVPGGEPRGQWRPRGPRPLARAADLRPNAKARRHPRRCGGDRPDRPRPPQQLELLVGPGVRPHLREPDDVRRE